MAHFAEIDDNNIVLRVLVIEQSEVTTGNWGDPAKWIQTSYNTFGGIHYLPNSRTPSPDQSKALHKNYAGIGYIWLPNGPDGPGFTPPQPFPSWTMDSFSYMWIPPVPKPEKPWPPDVIDYGWDEATQSWVPVYKHNPPINN